jgi:hypothetical protein
MKQKTKLVITPAGAWFARGLVSALLFWGLGWGLLFPHAASAQSCQTAGDLQEAVRASILAAGQRDFNMVAKGDSASLRQASIPSLAADFSGIEATVKDRQQDLAGAQASLKSLYLLDGSTPVPHGEFDCGVFSRTGQTPGSAEFFLDNLPAGKYAVVLFDATSAAARTMVSLILQQAGTDWKLGGVYIKSAQVAGHDGQWFLGRARECKAKGQTHNAYLFYKEALSLSSPLNFMTTLATDKLQEESQSALPADMPADGKTANLAAGTATYALTAIFPEAVENNLDLIVKYRVADISNTTQTYQTNVEVVKALVAKYPEMRDAFAAVVARAVDPQGRDYGTLLAMKDVK